MLTDYQNIIFDEVTSFFPLMFDKSKLNIIQNPSYFPAHIAIEDIVVSVLSALGLAIEKMGALRGLKSQNITIDKRLAVMSLRSCDYLFLNGWHVDYSYAQSPISNFFLTQDQRWIFYAGAYSGIRKIMLDFLGCRDHHEEIENATRRYAASFLEDHIASIGGSAVYCRTQEEWNKHPQTKSLLKNDIVQIDCVGDAKPIQCRAHINRPLSKIKVLDFTRVIAGPTIGRVLAEQGADVIHVRHPYLDRIFSFALESSFGKKMVSLDYKTDQDRQLILHLLKKADVFICGYRVDAMQQIGLSENEIRKINPHIIFVELTGYGAQGKWANRKCWEQLAQTCSGIAWCNRKNDKPTLLPVFLCDYLTGYLGALGTTMALIRRQIDGGQLNVKVSLTRTAMFAMEFCQYGQNHFSPLNKIDIHQYLIDQESHLGIITRLKHPIHFSETPSYAESSASYLGKDSLEINWKIDEDEKEWVIPHYDSVLALQGKLRVGEYAKNYAALFEG